MRPYIATTPTSDTRIKDAASAARVLLAAMVIATVTTFGARADLANPPINNTRPLEPQYRTNADGSIDLRLCFNSSCARTEMLTFTAADMARVEGKLAHCASPDLYDRLQRLRIAVWQMEVLAEKYQPLLANDREVNDREYGVEGRMDCVDKASNTTTYLKVLTDLGHLPSWQVDAPSVRRPLDLNAVHWTAVVRDEISGEKWAVDSWFRPNGSLPFVLPLWNWKVETKAWLPPYDALNPNPRFSNEFCAK